MRLTAGYVYKRLGKRNDGKLYDQYLNENEFKISIKEHIKRRDKKL